MIDNTMALLLPHGQTLACTAILVVTLAALMLMDFSADHRSPTSGDR